MVSPIDGFSAPSKSLSARLSEQIAAQSPAAMYDAANFNSSVRNMAYASDRATEKQTETQAKAAPSGNISEGLAAAQEQKASRSAEAKNILARLQPKQLDFGADAALLPHNKVASHPTIRREEVSQKAAESKQVDSSERSANVPTDRTTQVAQAFLAGPRTPEREPNSASTISERRAAQALVDLGADTKLAELGSLDRLVPSAPTFKSGVAGAAHKSEQVSKPAAMAESGMPAKTAFPTELNFAVQPNPKLDHATTTGAMESPHKAPQMVAAKGPYLVFPRVQHQTADVSLARGTEPKPASVTASAESQLPTNSQVQRLETHKADAHKLERGTLSFDAKPLELKSVANRSELTPAQMNPAKIAAELLSAPQYKQFHDNSTPCSFSHAIKPDSTSVTQTALAGPHKLWSLETTTTPAGQTVEMLKDAMGKERLRKEQFGDSWKIFETDYATKFGKETLWRSAVREYGSDGKQAVHYYSDGKIVHTQTV